MIHLLAIAALFEPAGVVAEIEAPPAPYELSAELLVGRTSNVRRAVERPQPDTLMALGVNGSGQLLSGRRLRGQGELEIRAPMGIRTLRQTTAGLTGDYGHPLPASLEAGVALDTRYDDEVTVFTETGTLPLGQVRTSMSGRLQPRFAWHADPWRVEATTSVTAKRVSGAESYTFTDIGAGVGGRFFPFLPLRVGAHAQMMLRRFDGLNVRKRDGAQPAVAPALEIEIVELGVELGSFPIADVELQTRLTVRRAYDTYDAYHSGQRARLEVRGAWSPESGPNAEASFVWSNRSFAERLVRTGQPGEERELELRCDVGYRFRFPIEPRLTYAMQHAASDEAGLLFTEHVVLGGVRFSM